MKFLSIFTLVVLITVAISSQGQKQMTKIEEAVKQTDGQITAALLAGDSAAVDAMLTDNYIEIDAQGLVRRKADVMAVVRAQAARPPSKSIGPEITDETKVHITGDTAILVGLRTTRYQHMDYQTMQQPPQTPDPTAVHQERFMKVYARVNARWQLAAYHATAIAKR
jgi:ketosteroid isomerase-like protein